MKGFEQLLNLAEFSYSQESVERVEIPSQEILELKKAWNICLEMAESDMEQRSKIVPNGVIDRGEEMRKFRTDAELLWSDYVAKNPAEDKPSTRIFFIDREAVKMFREKYSKILDQLWEISFNNSVKLAGELDKLEIWKAKFTTSASDNLNRPSAEDSWYYQSSSGMTIRLKNVNKHLKGLKAVIQKPMESIFFYDEKDKSDKFGIMDQKYSEQTFSKSPVKGYRVTEFRTQKFEEMLNDESMSGDYQSEISVSIDNGVMEVFAPPGSSHDGHLVNDILMSE